MGEMVTGKGTNVFGDHTVQLCSRGYAQYKNHPVQDRSHQRRTIHVAACQWLRLAILVRLLNFILVLEGM